MAATEEEIGAYAFRLWGYKQGQLVAVLVHLGERLGLFAALAGTGATDATGLAQHTGLDRRWLLEWLRGVAAAELVETSDGETFVLPAAAEPVLTDRNHLAYAAGAFVNGGFDTGFVDRLAESFQSGIGPSYDDQGCAGAHEVAGSSGPWARSGLVPIVLPRLDGVVDKLEAGARVLDVGCGAGEAMAALAEAFPASRIEGVDLSEHALDLAAVRLEGLPNTSLHRGRAEEVTEAGAYDLVLTLDVLHDLTRPADAAAAVARALTADGTWLVKEIRCWPTWEQNRKNPMLAMFYGFSVTGCLGSGTSEPGGAGLGTAGLHGELLQDMVSAAGFGTFEVHDVDDPANLYYEIRF